HERSPGDAPGARRRSAGVCLVGDKEEELSRIGKLPIQLLGSVKMTLQRGHVKVEGPKGQLEPTLPADITVKQVDGELVFERPSRHYRPPALHGLVRRPVPKLVTGVNTGFVKNLELVGVGYRVAKQGD